MENYRRLYWFKILRVLVDTIMVSGAFYGAYLIRFDFDVWPEYQIQAIKLAPVVVIIRITALYFVGGYHGLWKYTSLDDLMRLLKGILIGSVLLVGVNYFRNYPLSMAMALIFLASALVHRSLNIQKTSKRILLMGITLSSALVLCMGIYMFTVFASAPTTIAELPLGRYLIALDFQSALAMPRAVMVLESMLCFLLVCGMRVAPRVFRAVRSRSTTKSRRVLVFGAGDMGEHIVRAMVSQPEFGYLPVGFIDDHPAKLRASIHGVSVLGNQKDLTQLIDRLDVQELLIAIAAMSENELREIAAVCWEKRIPVRRIPGFASLLDGRMGLKYLEDVDVEKLLGRTEVDHDPVRVDAYVRNRVVLVTGAGGSIGSELCRQVGRCEPRLLVLLGKGENSIYHIKNELTALYSNLQVVCIIGDVRDSKKVDFVFRTHKPEVVFHAAAHKHVPLMQANPEEAILNNVLGTQNVAQAAIRYHVSKFVMISTDKAVELSSVMGASKRLAEMILQQLAQNETTVFVTVRFGNVLGSRGSVVPLFERQIREGGPLTVTHPEMTRYFMSIPEAVRLVLHSGAIGQNGDLCILDMGEPVRILDLAENMIIMAGKQPYEDIDIVFTGLRPGEALSEDLMDEEETQTAQQVDKIMVCRSSGNHRTDFDQIIEQLYQAAVDCQGEDIMRLIGDILPGYSGIMVSTEQPR
jgi:FlaA1/EpsC-like NDP-sugar epimerase